MGNTESCYNACGDAAADAEGRRPLPLQHKRRERHFPRRDADTDMSPISNQLLRAAGLDSRPAASPGQHLPMAPAGKQAPPLVLSGALPLFAHEQRGNTRPVAAEAGRRGGDAHSPLSTSRGIPPPEKDALDVSTLMSPMGFLLDQPEAYGPIFIAEVDEEGSARKLLKHPSIMLFEGDQILEVDACGEMRQCK